MEIEFITTKKYYNKKKVLKHIETALNENRPIFIGDKVQTNTLLDKLGFEDYE